jgi:hypothetical protein
MVSQYLYLNLQRIITRFMKRILSEKNLVVVLFVMVLITFSLAQEDSKKMEKIYSGAANAATSFLKQQNGSKVAGPNQISVLPSKLAE